MKESEQNPTRRGLHAISEAIEKLTDGSGADGGC